MKLIFVASSVRPLVDDDIDVFFAIVIVIVSVIVIIIFVDAYSLILSFSNVWKRILYAKICALWVCVDTKTLMFIMWCALKPFDSKVYWNNINLFAQLTFLLIQNTYTSIVSANLKFILLLLLFKRSSFHFSTLSRELFSIILFCVCVFVCRFYSLCGGMNITHIYLAICEIPMTTTEMKRKLCDTKT